MTHFAPSQQLPDRVQRRRCLDDRGWYAEDRNVVTQQNSDPAVDSTELPDNEKKGKTSIQAEIC